MRQGGYAHVSVIFYYLGRSYFNYATKELELSLEEVRNARNHYNMLAKRFHVVPAMTY